jgi:C4-dicarboxylate-specific signal transduction histidine kinase
VSGDPVLLEPEGGVVGRVPVLRQLAPTRPALLCALLTGTAYLLTSQIGLALRLPASTPSVLWPPNAVLTTALLLSPVSWWPLCLAAALPAHLVVQVPTGWPLPMIGLLFVTNCSEAVVGAGIARRLARGRLRLETVRGLAIFFVAVVVAGPFVSNFPDAAVVHWFRGEPFGAVWVQRFFSNTLSELTVVPAAIGLVHAMRHRRRWSARRALEAGAIVAGLVLTGAFTFSEMGHVPALRIVSTEAPIALYLPFLLWAGMRFGVGGVGLALLATSELMVYAAVHNHGPFRTVTLAGAVLPFQLSLTIMTSTLLVFTTLVVERRRALQALSDRFRTERVLARVAAAFVHVKSDRVQSVFDESLARLGDVLDLSAVALVEVGTDGVWQVVSRWTAAPRDADGWARGVSAATWVSAGLARGRTVAFGSDDLRLLALGLPQSRGGSVLALPMSPAGQVVGGLVVARDSHGPWRRGLKANLTLIRDILGNALARLQAEEQLRKASHEAQQQRMELAHVTRVATMGELASSLAHQLNQPLMTIAANVAAAGRLLERERADLAELRLIMQDVGEANRRASDAIRRVRALLRKAPPQRVELDLAAAVLSIAQILRTEAAARHVALTARVPGEPLIVTGHPVELQQVILNLVVNALEAIGDDRPTRVVVASAWRQDDGTVALAVEDTGCGIGAESEALVFEPFFTTKRTGLGMGLSITRSIVEAHGGTIVVRPGRTGGTIFMVTLPAEASGAAGRSDGRDQEGVPSAPVRSTI